MVFIFIFRRLQNRNRYAGLSPEQVMATAAAKSWEDLPDECWDIIFTSIDHHRHFEPLSLVNKRFLALTDHLRTTLTVPGHFLTLSPAALYSRFRRLHSVTLADPHPDIDGFVRGLAGAALPLISLHFSDQSHFPRDAVRTLPETIRSLSCARFREISDADLAVIADCFPYLERLDVSYPKLTGGAAGGVTDAGVIRISVKLRSLISLDVSGNVLISKRSIAHLVSNCASLRELKVRYCAYFGDFSIEIALFEAAKIASLSTLELSNAFFVNLSLQQLSGLKTKLEKVVFLSTGIFTNVALLFSAGDIYHSVHLQYVVFLSHLMAGDIATSMVNVEVVKFDHCVDLTDSHFFAIMSACRNLQEILNTETSELLNLKERVYLERDSGSICLSLSMNNEDSTVESVWEGEFVVSNSPEESVTVESDAPINIDGNEATDSSDNQAIQVQFLENPRAIEDMMDRYWLPIGWARILELVQMVKVDSGRNVEKTEFAYDEDDLTVANVAAPYWERPAAPTWWCHVDPLHPAVVAWLKSPQWLHPAVSIALTNESRLISERRKHLFYEVPVRVVGGLLFELLGQSVGDPHSYEDDSPIVPRSWQAQNFLVTAFHIKGNSSNINILGITEVREMFFDGWLWCAEKYS